MGPVPLCVKVLTNKSKQSERIGGFG